MSLRRQRGIALLVAIIMFALATTVAAAITYNKAMAARRAAATFTVEQAIQAGMAAEALASIALENSAGGSSTNLTQDWAQTVGPLEIEGTGVWIQAQLEDMQGRFNLNSLVMKNPQTGEFEKDPQQVEVFEALLQSLGLETRWATLMVDWIDSDIAPDPVQGGEDTLYLTQVPPYRPPNTFITHPSELLALQGFGAERYKKIAPYVSALPQDVQINVCDARGVVLDAARNDPSNRVEFGPLDRPASDQIEQQRKKGCYPTRTDWLAGVSGTNNLNTLAGDRVGEKSSWFRLRTNIRVGTTEFVLYSLLLREQRSNHVRVMQRSFGSE